MAEYTFKRKAYDALLSWKESAHGRSAVLVEGAPCVGKTTVVEAFAQSEYDDYLLLDFAHESPDILDNFRNVGHLDAFFRNLFVLKGRELPRRRAVLVFDEVQHYPLARSPSRPSSPTGAMTTSRQGPVSR